MNKLFSSLLAGTVAAMAVFAVGPASQAQTTTTTTTVIQPHADARAGHHRTNDDHDPNHRARAAPARPAHR